MNNFPRITQNPAVMGGKPCIRGLRVTVNSDDPAYFGGYIADNFRAVCAALPLEAADVITLCRNAAMASFLPAAETAALAARIQRVAEEGI